MSAPVKIAFLGGLGEIGRNCAVIEVENRLLLLDCGLMFPTSEMPGVDLVLPDFSWLLKNRNRIERRAHPRPRGPHRGPAVPAP